MPKSGKKLVATMLSSISSSVLQAFNQAFDRLDGVMLRLSSGDLDSLPEDMVDLSGARVQVAVAARLLKAADSNAKTLLDILV